MNKNILYPALFSFVLVFSFTYSFSQVKEKQNVAKVKIVENNQVILDTTIYNESAELENELDELLKESKIVILRKEEPGSQEQPITERDFIVIKRKEIDSMMMQMQDKMQEFRLRMVESEEYQKLREEMKENWEKGRIEMDSLRMRIMRSFDDFSPPRVYFYHEGDHENKKIIIMKSPEGKEEKVMEWTTKPGNVVVEKEVTDGKVDKESKVIVMKKGGEGKIVEIDGMTLVLKNGDVEIIENTENGEYKIISPDGRQIKIIVTDTSKEEITRKKRKSK
jgi:hypothetical protein